MKKAISILFSFCFMLSTGILISGCTEETKNTYNTIINQQAAPEKALFGEWVAESGYEYKIAFRPELNYIERAYTYEVYINNVSTERGYFIADGKMISLKQTHDKYGALATPRYELVEYEFTNNGQTLIINAITYNKVN